MYLKHFIYMSILRSKVSFWREGWEGFAEPWDDIDFISWFNSWLGWLVLTLPLYALQVCYCFMFYYRLCSLVLYTLKLFYFQIVKVLAKIKEFFANFIYNILIKTLVLLQKTCLICKSQNLAWESYWLGIKLKISN